VEQLPDSSDNQRPVKTGRYYDPIEYFVTTEEKSVKKRDPYFSNLKFILIFLVILGHLMEKHIYTNHDLYIIYTAIYMVHMPLFAFISGYFSKNSHKKLNHVWKIGGQYLLLHLGRLLVNLLITGEIGDWKSPYWYFWYLLSLFGWKSMGIFILYIKKYVDPKMTGIFRLSIVIVTIIIGCFSGALWWIGRAYSLSRTLVFFPFYYMGLCCSNKVINRIKEIRPSRKLLLVFMSFTITLILGSWLFCFVPVTFFVPCRGI
jgi:fucose 4-O-acetylase-like acetyltransferase